MLSLLIQHSSSVNYDLTPTELRISGEGEITNEGVLSKGTVSKVVRVIIEEGPVTICHKAFENLVSLEYVKISKTISKIIQQPFVDCKKLSKIVVDQENKYYCNDENFVLYTHNKNVLIKAPAIKDLHFPEGVQQIQTLAFCSSHFNYGDVVFPSTVSLLYENSFWDSVFNSIKFTKESQLTELHGFSWAEMDTFYVPSSVTTIKSGAFFHAIITNFLFEKESKLEIIGTCSFELFKSSTITLPDSLQTIGSYAFKESLLTTINIGSGCSFIESNAFAGCVQLTNIVISESNLNYSSNNGILMNSNCTEVLFIPSNLVTLHIPKTVTKLGQTMLQNSMCLKEITLDSDNSNWDTKDGVLYKKGFKNLFAVCGGVTEVKAHTDVVEVNKYAAFGCFNLESFTFLGTSITTIGEYSFSKSGLTSFKLPLNVNSIGKNAFSKTLNMTTFTMDSNSPLKVIPYYCFSSSVINEFTFGKNVEEIISGAFIYCGSLTKIVFPQDSQLKEIQYYAFEETRIDNVVIPSTVTLIYERAFRWCSKLETVTFGENSELTSISQMSFEYCRKLWKVVLPNSCKTLESKAFDGCTLLTSFTHNLETIGTGAFENCVSLENFNFSARQLQSSLNPSIFLNCYNIMSFNVDDANNDLCDIDGSVYSKNKTILYLFPPGLEIAKILPETIEFATFAFAWSPKLKFVAFYSDSNLKTIGETVFYECKKLTTVQFPAKLVTIKSQCFFGCSSLKSIFLPSSLSYIEEEAFIGCNMLKTVKYCGTKEIKGQKVFEDYANVLVNDLYPTKEFCSKKVFNKLSFDCELKPEFAITCGQSFTHVLIKSLFFVLFVNS